MRLRAAVAYKHYAAHKPIQQSTLRPFYFLRASTARVVPYLFRMVQLLVRLVARPGEAPEVLKALRSVLRPATQARGCSFAQVYREANDSQRLEYLEEWDDPEELRQQFGSERFVHLLELLETAVERPVVEFRIITEKHGLEYFNNPRAQTVADEFIH